MRHFGGHANALAQCRVRVNGLADVDGISAHLDGQCDLTNHVACMRTDHATTQNLAVTVGFRAVIKQQLGHAFIAAIGNRPA